MPATFPDFSAAWTCLSTILSLLNAARAGPCFQFWTCWRHDSDGAAEEAGWLPGVGARPPQPTASKADMASAMQVPKGIAGGRETDMALPWSAIRQVRQMPCRPDFPAHQTTSLDRTARPRRQAPGTLST